MNESMVWTELVLTEEDELWRGTVFRFSAGEPFEDIVDFMLVSNPASDSGFSIVCATGYKAGHLEANLPKEALAQGKVRAISANWLVKNWSEWVFSENHVSEIYIIPNYPKPEAINA